LGTQFAFKISITDYLDVFCGVAGYKKKIAAFLITVAIGGSALVVCSAQTSATEAKKITHSPYSVSGNDTSQPAGGVNTWELFLKMMAAVLLVVVLAVAAIYTSKKFLPKITNLPGKKIRIVETVYLGPRKTLHLLQIGNQQLLVGSTGEGITALADVTGALTDLPSPEAENSG